MIMKAMAMALLMGLVVTCGAQPSPPPPPETPPSPTPPPPKEASYWVTYNTKVRPGQTMFFNVLIIKGSSPVNVSASLMDAKGQKVILESDVVACTPGVMQVIPIEIPFNVEKPSPQRWENYQVRVVGEGLEVKFSEQGEARLQEQAFSIFIQTDKAIYKPRQEVKFRILSIDPQLQVMRDVTYDIVLKDAKKNRVLHLRDVDASKDLGVVQSKFRLADIIPTGDWKLEVTVLGFKKTKSFTVSDYVLPKFEVEIDAPTFGVTSDSFLDVNVKAKYTFGKPVSDGFVTVEIKSAGFNWYYREGNGRLRPVINFRGKLDRDGQYKVSASMESLLKLVQDHSTYKNDVEWENFVINATVTEPQTFKMRHAEHNLQYFTTPLKMEFLPITPRSYKAGLDFTSYMEVRRRDGSLFTPEEASKIKIKFNVTYEVKRETTISPPTPPSELLRNSTDLILEKSVEMIPNRYVPQITKVLTLPEDVRVQTLPNNGWLVIKFEIPLSATSFRIHAESDTLYNRSDHSYFYGNPANSPSDSFLQLKVTNHKPKVNDIVTVKAKATEAMRALTYQLTAKGILLHSERITPSSPSKEIEFEFLVESTMSPNLNLLAFFVRDDGEFVVDALSLSIEGLFANSVEVQFSKEKVNPGEDVDVIVKAKENSMVFLLAVDKSVKLLKSGNDITQELVRQELLKYENGNNYGHWRYMFICGWPSYNSGSDAAGVFSSAGVQVLTDGLIYREPLFFFDNDGIMESVPAVEATGSPGAAQQKNPSDPDNSETERLRSFFVEIMLWHAVTIPEQSNGEARLNLTAPDTITSWVASAFSSHPTDGFSVAAEPAELITFKNLFVSLDLPSFIVRDEEFCFTASVFNYYKMEVPVWVTMDKSSDYKGMYTTKKNDTVLLERDELYFHVILGLMKEGDIRSTKFCFTPNVLGIISIRVTAKTNIPELQDSVEHKIRVKPEGVPRTTIKPYLVSLQNGQWSENVDVLFPPMTVPGSEKITINVAGNLLASVFENMDNLVRQPYGCGEQNMINFAPLISLLKFFTVTSKLTTENERKIKDFMLQGYQRELIYEHGESGGYSTFGQRGENNPSTWLTAFVLKCFSQAYQLGIPFIDVDVVTRSALWLSKINRRNAFVEYGKVFNKGLQGGSGFGEALTAYSVIALHEAATALGQNSSAYSLILFSRNRGRSYLEARLDQLNDPYDVCIVAYALHLVDSKMKDTIFNKMEQLANISPGLKHWGRVGPKPTHTYYWSRNTKAIDIEMTSYALLTYNNKGIATDEKFGIPVLNWLSQQKNAHGGFISTQDTVTGIEALAGFLSEAVFTPMTVTVVAGNDIMTFDMTEKNEMLLHRFEVPSGSITNSITLQAIAKDPTKNLTSTVIVEVAQDFNVEQRSENDVFRLDYAFLDNTLELKIATVNGEMAGMTLVEIDIPSGYGVETKAVEEINPVISKAEWKEEDLLSLYFDTDVIGPREIKVQVPFIVTGGVIVLSKDKNIKVSIYYEPGSDLVVPYNLVKKSFCDGVNDFGHCPFVKRNTVAT